ncbi:MAG: hypothetical protein LHW45_03545 [Candidatus Cloacimonetes bacterium]|nr:hypothetical protein [Candidatus Cloacimonadota bacterium]MDY0366690.1 hypothetical protein [Candidatus Syntrophosphaera sp.]
MADVNSLFFEADEQAYAILGQNYLNSFLSTGVWGQWAMILSNKRLYVKGKVFVPRQGMARLDEDFNVYDLTGSSYSVRSMLLLRILVGVLFGFFGLAMIAIGLDEGQSEMYLLAFFGFAMGTLLILMIRDIRHLGVICKGVIHYYPVRKHKQEEVDAFRKQLGLMIDYNRRQMMK